MAEVIRFPDVAWAKTSLVLKHDVRNHRASILKKEERRKKKKIFLKGGNTRSGGLSDFAAVAVFLVLIVCVLLIDCVRSSNRGRPPFNHFRTEASCC